jgi:hypothetical protein
MAHEQCQPQRLASLTWQCYVKTRFLPCTCSPSSTAGRLIPTLTRLQRLDLSSNGINTSTVDAWFWVVPTLRYLDLSVLESRLETLSVYMIFLLWSGPEYVLEILLHYKKVANLRWAKLYMTTKPPAIVGIKLTYDGPTPNRRRLDMAPGGWRVCLTYDGPCPPS